MTNKPKRKHHEPHSHRWLKLFQAHPVEFLSPLTLTKCAQRLHEKRTVGQKANRLDVYITRRSPGTYKFHLERVIIHENRRGRDHHQRVRVEGELSYWDEESTLVKCKPLLGWQTWLWLGLAALLPVLLIAASGGETRHIVRGLALAIALPVGLLVWQINRAHEHRRLMQMVEEMLRYPIFY